MLDADVALIARCGSDAPATLLRCVADEGGTLSGAACCDASPPPPAGQAKMPRTFFVYLAQPRNGDVEIRWKLVIGHVRCWDRPKPNPYGARAVIQLLPALSVRQAKCWYRVEGIYPVTGSSSLSAFATPSGAPVPLGELRGGPLWVVARREVPAVTDRTIVRLPPQDLLMPYPADPDGRHFSELAEALTKGSPVWLRLGEAGALPADMSGTGQAECYVYCYTASRSEIMPRLVTHRLRVRLSGVRTPPNGAITCPKPVPGHRARGTWAEVSGVDALPERLPPEGFRSIRDARGFDRLGLAASNAPVFAVRRLAPDPVETAVAEMRRRWRAVVDLLPGDVRGDGPPEPFEELTLDACVTGITAGTNIAVCGPVRKLLALATANVALAALTGHPRSGLGNATRKVLLMSEPVRDAKEALGHIRLSRRLADAVAGGETSATDIEGGGEFAPLAAVADIDRPSSLRLRAGSPRRRLRIQIIRDPTKAAAGLTSVAAAVVNWDRMRIRGDELPCPAVFVANPAVAAERSERGVHRWLIWTPEAIESLGSHGSPAAFFGSVSCRVLPCPYETERRRAFGALRALEEVLGSEHQAVAAGRLLMRYARVMSTPRADFDAGCVECRHQPPDDLLDILHSAARSSSARVAAAAEDLRWALHDAFDVLEREQPKFEALCAAAREIASGGTPCVITADRAATHALERALRGAYGGSRTPGTAAWTGFCGDADTWVLSADPLVRGAPEFLAYPHAPGVRLLAYPFEAEALRQRLRLWATRLAERQGRAGGSPLGQRSGNPADLWSRVVRAIDEALSPVRSPAPEAVAGGHALDPFDTRIAGDEPTDDDAEGELTLSLALAASADATERGIPTGSRTHADPLSCVAVELEGDGDVVLIPEDATVEVLSDGKAEGVVAPELRAGDAIVVADGGVRKSLYDVLLTFAERSPDLADDLINVRFWRDSLREGVDAAKMTASDILRGLRQRGSAIEAEQTVRSWVRGSILGPRDPEDIRRLAATLGLSELARRHKEVNASVRLVRRLHRSLAHQLDQAVRQQRVPERDSKLFAAAGLRFADLRQVLQVRTIRWVRPKPVSASRDKTGIILRAGKPVR